MFILSCYIVGPILKNNALKKSFVNSVTYKSNKNAMKFGNEKVKIFNKKGSLNGQVKQACLSISNYLVSRKDNVFPVNFDNFIKIKNE